MKYLYELIVFGFKQAYACLFGGVLLFFILVTSYSYPFGEYLYRYDFLFLVAVVTQLVLILTKLETWSEAKVILLFHIVGTVMEVFKTSTLIGSWQYPEQAIFIIGNVPLFTGFMYAAVGSYIARSWRVMQLKFDNAPRLRNMIFLSVAIYANFFLHHFLPDVRILLYIITGALFAQMSVSFVAMKQKRHMPMLVAFFLISFFIWIGENVGTFSNTWVYPEQTLSWSLVTLQKWGSWFLLMIISFTMVYALHTNDTRLSDERLSQR